MRLAAKWRSSLTQASERLLLLGCTEVHRLPGGMAEVVRLGTGDPIVMVPGLAGGWGLLAPLAETLAQTNQVILYDYLDERLNGSRRGGIADHARDLRDLLSGLGLERPALFGLSFGTLVALELVAETPSQIGTLVLYGATNRFCGGLGYKVLRQVLDRYVLPTDSPFLNQFFNLLHGGRPEKSELSRFVVRQCWRTDQGVMAGRVQSLDGFDITDRLWRCDVPSLVLAGSQDVVIPPEQQRQLASLLPDARLEMIDGAGHVGFLTHRDEVVRLVRRHLASQSRLAQS